jgi:hypothetical protein
MSCPSCCSLHQEELAPKEAYHLECLVPTVKHMRGSVMVWAAISQYSVGPIIALQGQITPRVYMVSLGNQVHPMIQMLFQTMIPFSKMNVSPFTRLERFSHDLKSRKVTSTTSLANTITWCEHHWTQMVSFGDYSKEQIPTSNASKATWRCSSRRMV